MWNILDTYGATQTEKSLITRSTVNMFGVINEVSTYSLLQSHKAVHSKSCCCTRTARTQTAAILSLSRHKTILLLSLLLRPQRKNLSQQLETTADARDDARTRAMLLESELRDLQETDTQQQLSTLQQDIYRLLREKEQLQKQLQTFDQMKQLLHGGPPPSSV